MQSYLFEIEKKKSFFNLENYENSEITPICFRDLAPEITDTSYLTHSIYYYPAKFIPHVVKYCISNFSKEGDYVVDPFSGSGTVGLEAFLNKRNAYLMDLNLLLNHIIPVKIPKISKELNYNILNKKIKYIIEENNVFIPNWSNYEYWYPKEFLEKLTRYWGNLKTLEEDIYYRIIESVLVKLSKHYSYAEHKTPKLFKSKSKLKYVEELLLKDWKRKFDDSLISNSNNTLKDINSLFAYTKDFNNHVIFHGGIDSSSHKIEDIEELDTLISSPPYLQAQEYIRTTKLDLYWMGYNDSDIKRLSSLEIPYRKPNKIFETETLNKVKAKLERQDLIKMLDSYFCYIIQAFENTMNHLKRNSRACIFIGNPKIDGIELEIWRVLKEYFEEKDFVFEKVYEDKIKTRQLFGMRKNKNPDGMKSEYLLVLKKSK